MPLAHRTSTGHRLPATEVLGVKISAVNMQQTLQVIEQWITDETKNYVCVTGVHGVIESHRSKSVKRIHNRAGLVVPDGMPLVWLSRWAGHSYVQRVYGPDLMLATIDAGMNRGWKHYFYGGAPEVVDRLVKKLQESRPHLQICGQFCPPFRPLTTEEDQRVIEAINESEADIVWVGLSTPKQEYWMAAHVGRVTAPVLIGVGAAFDFNSGVKRQAPRWIQRSGFEWFFRMVLEPRRLGPRYLKNNPQFLFLLFQQLLLGGIFQSQNTRPREQ